MREYPVLRQAIILFCDLIIWLFGYYSAIVVLAHFKAINAGYFENTASNIPVLVLAATVIVLENGLLNLKRMNSSQMVISIIISVLEVLLVMATVSYFLHENASRKVFVLAAVFQAIGFIVWKIFLQRLEHTSLRSKRVLLMGTFEESRHISARLSAEYFRHYNLIYLRETELTADVRKKIAEMDLVILTEGISPARKEKLLHHAYAQGVEVVIVPSFHEILCLDANFDRFEDVPIFRLRKMRPTEETMFVKRCLDLVLSLPALFFLLPVMTLVVIAIKLESVGPVIYTQTRVGEGGKPFLIYKFRSMYCDAEKHTGPVLAICSDPRVTRIGRFLRATRLDELPQLVNVVLGQMSLVGPRPERPVFVDQFNRTIPAFQYRHSVKPGITGLAQVYGRYNTDVRDKLVYDLLYIQKCSLVMDLDILFRTVKILFIKEII